VFTRQPVRSKTPLRFWPDRQGGGATPAVIVLPGDVETCPGQAAVFGMIETEVVDRVKATRDAGIGGEHGECGSAILRQAVVDLMPRILALPPVDRGHWLTTSAM